VERPPCSISGCQQPSHARNFCRAHYAAWFTEGAPVCTTPGCTKKALARGLCATHYEYVRRHGGLHYHQYALEPPRQQNSEGNSGGYDERFTGLFLDELELRGSPRYPQPPWFTALSRADDEYRRLGPLKAVLRAYQSPESSGVPESLLSHRSEEDLSRSVNRACTAWLARH
jgi:hypothetical protein